MRLRNVGEDDLAAYYRIWCDPVMMARLGGPQPRDSIPAKLRRHAESAANDDGWCSAIVLDEADPRTIAGIVSIDRHGERAEIGWAVLPEHQGRGVGKAAVRLLLDRAAADGRWGVLHAFPGVDNPASNGICRSLGFRLLGEEYSEFAGQRFRSNHWVIEPPGYGGDMTPEDFLRTYHDRTPGSMGRSALAAPLADGRTSYEFLAEQVAGAKRILDLGCADGTLLAMLARAGADELAGVDLSEGELALARERPELRGADLRVARAQELPFADDSFDAVVSHMALMLMTDVDMVIAEVARVLRPGGVFAVAVGASPVPGGALELLRALAAPVFAAMPPERRIPSIGDRRARSREGLDGLLAPAGFAPVSWTDLTLELTGTPEELWATAVPSYYDVAVLDERELAGLRTEFVAKVAGLVPGAARISVAATRLGQGIRATAT